MRVNKWQRPDLFLINAEAITTQCKDSQHKGQRITHAIKANYLREMCFPQHKLKKETKAKYINEHAAVR